MWFLNDTVYPLSLEHVASVGQTDAKNNKCFENVTDKRLNSWMRSVFRFSWDLPERKVILANLVKLMKVWYKRLTQIGH